jgi:hypothetical protein
MREIKEPDWKVLRRVHPLADGTETADLLVDRNQLLHQGLKATKLGNFLLRFVYGAGRRQLSKEEARECRRRINNYRALERKLDQIIADAFENAPWVKPE